MPSVVDALTSFNRRERHILVGWVLDKLTFQMGYEFRDALSKVVGVPIPADSFVAMDYNLNWLCAALMWADGLVDEEVPQRIDPSDGLELGDNSDSDLVVAFARGHETHIILLEAKGYTPWATSQIAHKMNRLIAIFGGDGRRFSRVTPYWVLVSPNAPPRIQASAWLRDPRTDLVRHLPLPQPASHKFALSRCDASGKKADAGYWKIRHDRWPGTL